MHNSISAHVREMYLASIDEATFNYLIENTLHLKMWKYKQREHLARIYFFPPNEPLIISLLLLA